MIFITHKDHGAMHVVSQAESLAHQKNGWMESTYAQWLGDKAKPVEDAQVEPAEVSKKRGRPAKA